MPLSGRFNPGNDSGRILKKAYWTPGSVWTGVEKLTPPPGFEPLIVDPLASHCPY